MSAVTDQTQLDLFGPLPTDAEERSIEEAFRAFHQANRHVYDELVALARDMRSKGHTRIGMGMLFEVLRWQRMIRTSGDEFRLNNSWRSRYSRLIAANEPDLADAFETRRLRNA